MQLSLNLTFQLKRTSHQSTTKPDGTLRPGAYENTLPSYDTTTSPGGSQPKANSFSGPRKHATKSHSVSKTTEKLSHTRSLGKKISRMFNKFSSTQYSNNFELEGSVPQGWSLSMHSELPGESVSEMSGYQHPSELPSYTVTRQLSELSSYDTYRQQPVPGNLQAHGVSSLVVNREEPRQHPGHQHDPNHIDTLTNQQRFSSQALPHAQNSTQASPTSVWMPSPRDLSSLEGHSGYSHQPLVAKATALSHSRSIATADSIPYTNFAPSGPLSYNNGESGVNEYRTWNDNTGVDQATFSNPLPAYPSPPPYGNRQHGDEVNPSISPVSSHHGHADDHHGSSTFPPTPMASPPNLSISFSPTESLQQGFEGIRPSPSSQVFNRQGLPAVIAPNSTQLVTVNSTSYSGLSTSHWERHISRGQHSYQPDQTESRMPENHVASLAGVDETLLSYNESPSPPCVVNYDTTHSFDVASPQTTSDNRGHHSLIARGLKRLLPLVCGHCEIEFNGRYQMGNLQRHIRRFHSTTVVDDRSLRCRSCPAVYKRADARKKHEWKKHKTEDCRPEKRRVEKRRVVEKRIYMPNMPEFDQSVIG